MSIYDIKEQIARRKAEFDKKPACYQHAGGNSGTAYIEFWPDAHTRIGFPYPVCHYTLDPNPTDSIAAPERLTLAFQTADVVIVGARLTPLLDNIKSSTVASVNTLDSRYAEALRDDPWVAKITVKFFGKQQA